MSWGWVTKWLADWMTAWQSVCGSRCFVPFVVATVANDVKPVLVIHFKSDSNLTDSNLTPETSCSSYPVYLFQSLPFLASKKKIINLSVKRREKRDLIYMKQRENSSEKKLRETFSTENPFLSSSRLTHSHIHFHISWHNITNHHFIANNPFWGFVAYASLWVSCNWEVIFCS